MTGRTKTEALICQFVGLLDLLDDPLAGMDPVARPVDPGHGDRRLHQIGILPCHGASLANLNLLPFLYKSFSLHLKSVYYTFCGCAINGVLSHGIDNLTEDILGDILTYANGGAALITYLR